MLLGFKCSNSNENNDVKTLMQASLKKLVALTTLIIFTVGAFAYHFNSERFSHELDHDTHTFEISHNHSHTSLIDNEEPKSKSLSDADHQLLHSISHFQPYLASSVFNGTGNLFLQINPVLSHVLLLPLADIEPLFRPPRNI